MTSHQPQPEKTLQWQPTKATALFGLRILILLTLLIGLAEALARSPLAEALLPPSIDTTHTGFDLHWAYLENFGKAGEVDCIFLGSSVVESGLKPSVFEAAYTAQTGEELRCFTFGISALSVGGAAEVAALLVARYQPRYLIYGSSPGEYIRPTFLDFINRDWFRDQTGESNLNGWLIEQSRAYRYYLRYQRWRLPDFQTELERLATSAENIQADGYLPLTEIALDVRVSPDPQTEAGLFGFLSDYQIHPVNLAGLHGLAALHNPDSPNGTRVILLEIPVHPSYIEMFGRSAEDYRLFTETLNGVALEYKIPFWQTSPLDLIADDLWYDRNHVLDAGADLLSEWFGTQFGLAVTQGLWSDEPLSELLEP